ncbi:Thiamin pyrophosphokinase catalytic domain-containing protein [Thermaerobacter marianensis DSM 12885]|uniref:Thiamin pyrophosphokinase catalytic domain-containing protein n=1 Tax=Thermaerobacter marianensis (strain ATCC 700841 / DSM 12885 / JCM 10246 / 7p75a) TaxID=644966 RepID=E6SKR1_THEM7|nr:putative cytokinetic ring protein SteA [Thermaerobacter marianensis]ADU51269.1 Thiamin pyrophosphokinase catalytic domain-containing protein [Thermaerobacter marianensis DSM 12885]
MRVTGTARVDRRTKRLVRRLRPGDIAVVAHRDMDEVAARSLVDAGVRAVLNAEETLSGRYPAAGAACLLEAGIPVVDGLGDELLDRVRDGDPLRVEDGTIWSGDRLVARGTPLTRQRVEDRLAQARANLDLELARFLENTLEWARRERDLILGRWELPPLRTRLQGRPVLLVARGPAYRDDLAAIRPYIEEVRPVLVGIDGGADALLAEGYRPDLIIGDMDSVSDRALRCGAELVVHAYPDGRAPGEERLRALGLPAACFAAPGTSEDAAMLLAYQAGADLLVAVGTHTNLVDFLDKGRAGMASTLLVRLKVGTHLVDAKGVSRLYRSRVTGRHLLHLVVAALVPVAAAVAVSPWLRTWLELVWLRVRVALGW